MKESIIQGTKLSSREKTISRHMTKINKGLVGRRTRECPIKVLNEKVYGKKTALRRRNFILSKNFFLNIIFLKKEFFSRQRQRFSIIFHQKFFK